MSVEQLNLMEYEPEINEDTVIHYSKHAREMSGGQKNKALKLLKHRCVKYVGDVNEYLQKTSFIVLPLDTYEETEDPSTGLSFEKVPYKVDYNSTVYTITREIVEGYEDYGKILRCNCQGWETKKKRQELQEEGCSCAHVLALFLGFKLKNRIPDIFEHKINREEQNASE